MIRLRHRPAIDGSFRHSGDEYRIDDGVIEVDNPDVAREMAKHRRIEILEIKQDEADDDSEDICGTEMSDGSICERPAESCPYH